MDIVEQMRSFESDHEPDGWPAIQMKQVSALCDEVERLRSIINAANAQEPFCTITHTAEDDLKTYRTELHYRDDVTIANIPSHVVLYARPIPAQQSQVATSDKVLFNGSHGHAGYVVEDQQSPAVAVPAKTETIAKELSHASVYLYSYVEQLEYLLSTSSPRITEQDARKIALSAWRYWMNNCDRTVDNWVEDEGLDLTNKLNGVTNETN